MEKVSKGKVRQINNIINETESVYHQASLSLGLSDSESMILYAIYEDTNICLLSDVYKKTGICKQTVNSALRKLEKRELLFLENYNGKLKKIVLTNSGEIFVEKTVAKIYQAEINVFNDWSKEEIENYIYLLEKYKNTLQKKVNLIIKDSK